MLDERYKSTQKPAGTEKSLPLEGGAPRSESKIYMTAGGSHTSTTVVRLKPDRMRGGRQFDFECRGEARLARQVAIFEQ